MKVATFVLASLLSFSPLTGADLQVYESFSYPAGADLHAMNGGTGFGESWDADSGGVITVSSGLSYPGLASAGNAVTSSESGSLGQRAFSPLIKPTGTGDTTWMSFLLRLQSAETEAGNEEATTFAVTLETDVITDSRAVTLGAFPSETTGLPTFGIFRGFVGEPQGGISYFAGDPPVVSGATFLLVTRILWDIAGNETITLFVDPVLGAGDPSQATGVTRSDINLINGPARGGVDQVQRLLFASGAPTLWNVDEFWIGNTFEDVTPVPEPALSLLLAGGAFLLAGRRRRCGQV